MITVLKAQAPAQQLLDLSKTKGCFGIIIQVFDNASGAVYFAIGNSGNTELNSALVSDSAGNEHYNGFILPESTGTGANRIIIPTFADVLWARNLDLTNSFNILVDVTPFRIS